MESVNTVRQSTALPSIKSYIDLDKTQADEKEHQRRQSTPNMTSPSYPPTYSGPPPSYSHTPTSATPSNHPSVQASPESRRTSADEKDQRHPSRQSLPSIHEALGSDASFPPPLPPPPSSAGSVGPLHFHHSQTTSPTDTTRTGSSIARSPFLNQISSGSQTQQPECVNRTSFSSSNGTKLPSLQPIRTGLSHPDSSHTAGQQRSHAYDSPSAVQHTSAGYPQHPPSSYPYSAPPQAAPSTGFSSHNSYPGPPRYGQNWRPDTHELNRVDEIKRTGRLVGPGYGESVKRHLDNFDFEASINEITDGTGRITDFTKRFGARAHQTQRSGPVPGSLPAMVEVDELLKQNQRIHESILRIREVVAAQQTSLAEQAQDPRMKTTGFDQDDQSLGYHEDAKSGGFAGPDPKKRRGRAAPPGRCHSCNRAETPEWRRGPDGARTLCNACGLHYAKLTRKMGSNKAALISSNLKPKTIGPNSPSS